MTTTVSGMSNLATRKNLKVERNVIVGYDKMIREDSKVFHGACCDTGSTKFTNQVALATK